MREVCDSRVGPACSSKRLVIWAAISILSQHQKITFVNLVVESANELNSGYALAFMLSSTPAAFDSTRYTFTTSNHPA